MNTSTFLFQLLIVAIANLISNIIGEDNLYSTLSIEEAMDLVDKLGLNDKTLCIVGTQSLVADTKRFLDPNDLPGIEVAYVAL